MARQTHKIAALFYVVWGLLHLKAAQLVYSFAQSVEVGMVQGRLFQDAGFLLFFGVVSVVVAVRMNWRNSVSGYWINLIGVSAVDVLFLLFLIVPGYVPLWPGLLGPICWVLAATFSTAAILSNEQSS